MLTELEPRRTILAAGMPGRPGTQSPEELPDDDAPDEEDEEKPT